MGTEEVWIRCDTGYTVNSVHVRKKSTQDNVCVDSLYHRVSDDAIVK